MRRFCVFVVVMLVVSAKLFAQEELHKPLVVTNYLTPKYCDIPVSRTSILPPPGFVRTEEGFSAESGDALIIADHTIEQVRSRAERFMQSFVYDENTDSTGAKLLEVIDVKLNGFSGLLAKMLIFTNDDAYYGWRLYIGDENSSDAVTVSYPTEKEEKLGKAIQTSLLSAFFDKDKRFLPPGADATTTSSKPCDCEKDKIKK